jgi:hypothetical protein
MLGRDVIQRNRVYNTCTSYVPKYPFLIYQESNQVQFISGRMCKEVSDYWPCNFRSPTVRIGQSDSKGTDFHKNSCFVFL